MCPRRDPDPNVPDVEDRLALSCMPASRERFRDILTRMHIPDVFLDTIFRPRAAFKKLYTSVEDQDCEGIVYTQTRDWAALLIWVLVYILCVDSILKNYTAMCITYFPHSQQVFGLYLGYDDSSQEVKDDVTDMISRLLKNEEFLDNPFVLISAFLEIEKKHRLRQVDNIVNRLQNKINNSQQALRGSRSLRLENGEQQRDFYTLYTQIGNLKLQLAIWKSQLDKLLAVCCDLPELRPKRKSGFVIKPEDYVQSVKESFEESYLRCENVLQTMSLAFQKVGPL